ncbi:MAG: hemolysin family protein, partial [Elusimicrobiota bacterium]|nr:hemolysin family protein [Elusimicrobiota bacterium]
MTLILIKVLAFLIVFLVMIFFAGSETALTALPRIRIKRLIAEGIRAARGLSLWLQDPNRLLTTILIGNALAVIFASVLATSMALDFSFSYGWSQKLAVGYATAIVTFFIIVFGEIMPKTYARKNAEKISAIGSEPLRWIAKLLSPLSQVLVVPANLLIQVFGGRGLKGIPLFTTQEIGTLIEVGAREGALDDEEKRMIQSSLEFGETIVREVMVPRIDMECVDFNDEREEIFKKIMKMPHSRVPVYKGNVDNVIGIVYTKDLLTALRNRELIVMEDIMRQVYFVPETKKISELLEEFKKGRMHLAIVVDEYGVTTGLVTIEDLIEEITGEILDEYDVEKETIVKLPDGTAIVYAKEDLDKINEKLGLELPAEDFDSLGGLVIDLFGRVP